jgi:hypothetical protein
LSRAVDAVQRSFAKTVLVALALIAVSACGAPDTPATSRWIGYARAAEAQGVTRPDTPPSSEPELTTEQRLAIEAWRRIDAARRETLECEPAPTALDLLAQADCVRIDTCKRGARAQHGWTRKPIVSRIDGDARNVFLLVEERLQAMHDRIPKACIELRSCVDGSVIAAAAPRSCPDAGVAFASGRDVDGDGVGDFAIGHSNGMGCERGCVEVFSGVDLRTLRVIDELAPGGYIEGFCASVAFVRDLDGDGAAEIFVGCEEDIDSGDDYYVAVFSGRSGKLLDYSPTFGRFVRVAALDQDVDGDGKDEFLLHHPENGDAWIVRGGDVGAKREQAGWRPLYLLTSRAPTSARVSLPR